MPTRMQPQEMQVRVDQVTLHRFPKVVTPEEVAAFEEGRRRGEFPEQVGGPLSAPSDGHVTFPAHDEATPGTYYVVAWHQDKPMLWSDVAVEIRCGDAVSYGPFPVTAQMF